MKWFRKAAAGAALALLGAVCFRYILEYVIGVYTELSTVIVFSVLIGACTGLIYSKLCEVHDDLCTTFAQQEKIKAMVERLDKNVRALKSQAADRKETSTDEE